MAYQWFLGCAAAAGMMVGSINVAMAQLPGLGEVQRNVQRGIDRAQRDVQRNIDRARGNDNNRDRGDWQRDRNNRSDWDRDDWQRYRNNRNDWDRDDWQRYRNRQGQWDGRYGRYNDWYNYQRSRNWNGNRYTNNWWRTLPWIGLGGYGYGGYGRGGIGWGLGSGFYNQGGWGPWYGYYGNNAPQRYYAGRVDTDTGAQVAQDPVGAERDYAGRAFQAFRAEDYHQAIWLINHALVDTPDDGQLYLLGAQTLFALGDYEGSAAMIHRAATMLDEDQWGNVVKDFRHYYSGKEYVEQMDALKQFIRENPDHAAAYFVRGYQFGFLGQEEAAVRDLTKAFELENRDQLAANLIGRFGGEVPEGAASQAEVPREEAQSPR